MLLYISLKKINLNDKFYYFNTKAICVLFFAGAVVRYMFDFVKYKNSSCFKEYHNYNEKPELEMLDAIIGFFIIGILIVVLVSIFHKHGW